MADKKKEPMIEKGDRPGQIDLDRPLSEMKLRDLVDVLGGANLPERIKPEQIKPEWYKPEGVKPEWYKPEWIKPEGIKPELLKERFKPELTKPPFEIDEWFDPVLETLSQDQLKRLSEKVNERLRG